MPTTSKVNSRRRAAPKKRNGNTVKQMAMEVAKLRMATPKRAKRPSKNGRNKNVSQAYSAPLSVGVVAKSNATNKRNRFTAEARFVTLLEPVTDLKTGRVLVNRLFSPQNIQADNFNKYCDVWAKYSIEKMEFRYVPDASSTTTGRVIMAWVPDPEFELQDAGTNSVINQLRGSGVCSVGSYWTPQTIDVSAYLKHDRSSAWGGWFTNPNAKTLAAEPYWCSPGRFIMVCDGTAGGTTGPMNISVDVCITLSFWEPVVRSDNTPSTIRTNIDVSILTGKEPYFIHSGTTGLWDLRDPAEIGQQTWNQAREILTEIQVAANLGVTPINFGATAYAVTRMENYFVPYDAIEAPTLGQSYNTVRNSTGGTSTGLYLYADLKHAIDDAPKKGTDAPFGFGDVQMLTVSSEPVVVVAGF